jgi:hypothetical protein
MMDDYFAGFSGYNFGQNGKLPLIFRNETGKNEHS